MAASHILRMSLTSTMRPTSFRTMTRRGQRAHPEEVAVAYMTFQNAKAKYREQAKSRGYRGENGKENGKDGGKGSGKGEGAGAEHKDKTRDEKLKQIKARSFCSGCGAS